MLLLLFQHSKQDRKNLFFIIIILLFPKIAKLHKIRQKGRIVYILVNNLVDRRILRRCSRSSKLFFLNLGGCHLVCCIAMVNEGGIFLAILIL